MNRFLALIFFVATGLIAQTPTSIRTASTLPGSCGTGETYIKTGSSNSGLYTCMGGTWTRVAAPTVISFGADSSGAVDATASFTALNAVTNTVIVPAFGVYKINNWVPLANTTVECSNGATLKRSSNVAVFTASNANVYFKNCTIDGNSLTANLADITGAHFWFDHGAAHNAGGYGLYCHTGCDYEKITDSTFTLNTLVPIVSDGSTQGGTVIGNDITQSSGDSTSENKGIQLHATGGGAILQDWVVSGNHVNCTAVCAIQIEIFRNGGATDVTINNTVTGNTLESTALIFAPISISGGINTAVTANVINAQMGVIQTGIEITDSRHTTCTGNTATVINGQSATSVIEASDKSVDSLVADNTIYTDISAGRLIIAYGDANFGEPPFAYRIKIHHNIITMLDGGSGSGIVAGFCNAANCTGNNVEVDNNIVSGPGGTGWVTWSGTAVTYFGNGEQFKPISWVPGQLINLGGYSPGLGTNFTIATVNSPTSITLTASAGTQATPAPYQVAVLDGSTCVSEFAFFPHSSTNLVINHNTCKNLQIGLNRSNKIDTSYLLDNVFDNVPAPYAGSPSAGEIRSDPVYGAFSTPGAVTFSITNATNATPIVITTDRPTTGLVDGTPIAVGGVNGNNNANGSYFAKVTGFTSTTFAEYADAALTTPIPGSGAYVNLGGVTYGGSFYHQVDGPRNMQIFSGLYSCTDVFGTNCIEESSYQGWAIGPHGIAGRNLLVDLPGTIYTHTPGTIAPGATDTFSVGVAGCKAGSPAKAGFDQITSANGIEIKAVGYAGNVAINITNTSASPITMGMGTGQVTCEVYAWQP